MKANASYAVGLVGLLAAGFLTPAWAQTAPGAEQSFGCRIFPLGCPVAVPPPPPPLLGTPEEQAAAATPPAAKPVKARHHVRKRAHKQAQ